MTCQGPDALDKCLTCNPGSYLKDGKCVPDCSDKCLACENADKCILCDSGYTIFSFEGKDICAKCVSNCRKCVKC